MASSDDNASLELDPFFRSTPPANHESPSEAYEPITFGSRDDVTGSPPIPDDLDVEPSNSEEEDLDDDLDLDPDLDLDEGVEDDCSDKSDKTDKSIDGDDDSDWIEEIQSVSDAVFESESANENNTEDMSVEETRDDSSAKSDDVHGWHERLNNVETASPTDSYPNSSHDTLRSNESIKSQESFNFQPMEPLDDLALDPAELDLSQEMREIFQKSQCLPKFTRKSPPPKSTPYPRGQQPSSTPNSSRADSRPDDSMTSDTSDLDVERGRRKKSRKGHDSDTTSEDSDASLEANHEDSDSSSSSSSSDGTQIWVPIQRTESFKKTLDTQSAGRRTPQRSNTMSSVRSANSNPSSPTGNGKVKPEVKRIVAKHNHSTGRVETYIDDGNGDSGIHSTDSPLLSRGSRPPSFQSLDMAGRQTPPTSSILKNAKEKSPRGPSFTDCLFNSLSSVYCAAVVVLGLVLPMAEIFAEQIPQNLFECFYIYICGLSILFLCYVYLYLLQNKTAKSYRKHRRKRSDRMNGYTDNYHHSDRSYQSERSRSRHYERSQSRVGIVTGSTHTGSFYLRLGAVVFGIGSMIHDGLKFSEIFDWQRLLDCGMILSAVRPILHLVFTFIQLYFIFLNSKMCIHKYTVLARFGLMHMLATNVCVWISVTVGEIVRAVISQPTRHRFDVSNLTTIYLAKPANSSVNCSVQQDLMGRTVELASPYLYPLTAQYSIVCIGILFVMWQNIGNPLTKDSSYSEPEKKKSQWVVDCQGSNKGLFLGILFLVAAIVSMIVFYVLIERKDYTEIAIIVVYSSDIVLYSSAIFATILAFIMMRNMRFYGNLDLSLDQAFLMLGTGAVFFYSVLGLVAGVYNRVNTSGLLAMICACTVLVQTGIQTVFIFTGLRRFCNKNGQQLAKPGREFVTFLLVCNIALWGMATFESLRLDANPIQYDFYGFLPWTMVNHVCIPFGILYRFHSTVCLANIWKSAYKIKLQ